MGLFDQFPYTNFHELNLMWILKALKEIQTTTEQFVAINSLKYANPIQWNIVKQYEKNTIVIDPLTGTAYISVHPVPTGVALTNTDYWTVVFDLGSFVTRAAKNFTERWEEDTTLTATFPTAAGEWLVWGDTLYVAQVNITAGDQYVVDSNIKRITIEEVKNDIYSIMGNLADLSTTDKSSLVAAINEVLGKIGDLDDLNTTDKSNLVAAINKVLQTLIDTSGDPDNLNTTDKSNLVAAINEVLQTLIDTSGDPDNLNTTDKSNLVAAINSLKAEQSHSFNSRDYRVYVDSVNGSDNNDGLSEATAYATLDKALDALNLGQKTLDIAFVNGATFNITEHNTIANCDIHVYNSTGNNITIVWPDSMVFYNSRIRFLGASDAIIYLHSVTTSANTHTDFCQFYLEYTYIRSRFTFISSYLYGVTNVGFGHLSLLNSVAAIEGDLHLIDRDNDGYLREAQIGIRYSLFTHTPVAGGAAKVYLDADLPNNINHLMYIRASSYHQDATLDASGVVSVYRPDYFFRIVHSDITLLRHGEFETFVNNALISATYDVNYCMNDTTKYSNEILQSNVSVPVGANNLDFSYTLPINRAFCELAAVNNVSVSGTGSTGVLVGGARFDSSKVYIKLYNSTAADVTCTVRYTLEFKYKGMTV